MFTFDINHNHEIASEIIEHKGQAFSFEKGSPQKKCFMIMVCSVSGESQK